MRRLLRLLAPATAAGLLLAVAWTPQDAQAASYRYWSYWLGADSTWTYAAWGPASVRPEDGSVQGWRFGVGEGTAGAGLTPRSAPDFDRICAETPAAEGSKRVAIVIDPGLAEHAPAGETPAGAWAMCVTAPVTASGFDILREAASVRTQQGMVCGLAGYPARECAVIVDAPRPTPVTTTPQPESTPTPTPSTGPSASSRPAPTGSSASTSPPSPLAPPDSTNQGPQTDDRSGTTASTPLDSDSSAGNVVAGDAPYSTPPESTGGSRPSRSSPSGAPSPITSTSPSPDVTIVSATVTDPSAGPGPTMAIIGAVAIVMIAALALLRRRSTR